MRLHIDGSGLEEITDRLRIGSGERGVGMQETEPALKRELVCSRLANEQLVDERELRQPGEIAGPFRRTRGRTGPPCLQSGPVG